MTYTYRREDGTTFEVQQRITDPPFTADPTDSLEGGPVERVITGGSTAILKGSGFHSTDYSRRGPKGLAK